MRAYRLSLATLVLLLAITPLGCSISDSSSAIVSSPSTSLSWSSHGRTEAYEMDVRDYTEASLRSSTDVSKFMTGISGLATKNGISNWEAEPATYIGIGRGLKKANVPPTQFDVYKTNFSKGDATKAANIQMGYDAEED